MLGQLQPNAPLSGLRIIDTTKALAGPYCTMILADLGADVIKVERPPYGDPTRFVNVPRLGNDSAYFMGVNRGKRSVVIDLAQQEGRDLLYGMIAKADVFIENNRPPTNKHLGIDYESLKRYNPAIIAASISGFGHTGPETDEVGLDLSIQARSGLMSLTGSGKPDEAPLRLGLPMSDIGAAVWAAMGILSALQRRARTGEGAHVDVALFDASVAFTSYMAANYFASGVNPPPVGSGHHSAVPYQAFRASDRWFVVAVFASLVAWQAFCKAIDRPDLAADDRYKTNVGRNENREELVDVLERHMLTQSADHWLARMAENHVPASPVNELSDVFEDKQLLARDMVAEMDHPVHGKIRVVGNPIRFADWSTGSTTGAAPMLGEHTEPVLSELLGLGAADVADLIERGLVQGPRPEPTDAAEAVTPG